MDEFTNWLILNQLEKYADILQQNDITSVDLLIELSEDDLKELGFSLGDRKRFTIALKNISNNSIDLSPDDLALINSLPYVIAYPLKRTLLEKHPWTKINLLKDTFLNFLKYLGLLSASEFFNSEMNDKGMVALFHKNLMETAFGKWNHYIRECLAFLKQQNHTFFYPELVAFYELVETGNKSKKYKGEIEYQDVNGDTQLIVQTSVTSIGMLINFRNRYLGHGQTLDEDKSEKLWNEYFPIFRNLLEQLSFTKDYPMLKREHGETYLLHSAEMTAVESNVVSDSNIWIQNNEGNSFDILPFFIVPGEVSLAKEDKEQLLTYESYTGKTIKFFSPEGTEKQTSGKILEKLNLLLRDKQKETPFTTEAFTKDEFLKRIEEENKLLLDTLISEKKIIPGIYQHREEMEIKLREWIGARANIFFIVAEAGSGKTNLLAEIQRQYTERQLPSLFIRAGRMEKQSLKEQITYLLNIDLEKGLEKYASIAGTQAEPTFILIDGLNEANNAEEIWQDIIDISKVFIPGSIKFVVTNRANTKAELSRYIVSENDFNLLYGENKDNESELGAYSFWLKALDMQQMKGAWENYATKDKAKFKPQFNFDAIAEFDRRLYNQINNPLILRLFLEIYNGKALPKKGVKHLNIWQDWLKTFSTEEQLFLKLVANEVWRKGENELLLDDLLKNEILKPYFTSDIINAPYNRLKSKGWLSRYVKDLNGYVGFTVEGSLLYLLALQLQDQKPVIDLATLQSLLKTGSKLQKSAVESFLCEQALNGDLNLVVDLIDSGNKDISLISDLIDDNNSTLDLVIPALTEFSKTYGADKTLCTLFNNPTDLDWLALYKLIIRIDELLLYDLEKEMHLASMKYNKYDSVNQINVAIKSLRVVDQKFQEELIFRINKNESILLKDIDLVHRISDYYYNKQKNLKAIGYLKNYLDSVYSIHEGIDINEIYHTYGRLAKNISSFLLTSSNSLEYLEEYSFDDALDYIDKAINGLKQSDANPEWIASLSAQKCLIYKSMNTVLKIPELKYQEFKAINARKNQIPFSTKQLNLKIRELSNETIQNALKTNTVINYNFFYNSLAETYGFESDINQESELIQTAHKCYSDSIDMNHKLYGAWHPNLSSSYNNLANFYHRLKDYENAQKYYEKALDILIFIFGKKHMKLIDLLIEFGGLFEDMSNPEDALGYYKEALEIALLDDSYAKVISDIYYKMALIERDMFNNFTQAKNYLIISKEYLKDNELGDSIQKSAIEIQYNYTFWLEIQHLIEKLENYSVALGELKKLFLIEWFNTKERHGGIKYWMGVCYENMDEYGNAFKYYLESATLRKEAENIGLQHEKTKKSIASTLHIAKHLNKENELPDWMMQIN